MPAKLTPKSDIYSAFEAEMEVMERVGAIVQAREEKSFVEQQVARASAPGDDWATQCENAHRFVVDTARKLFDDVGVMCDRNIAILKHRSSRRQSEFTDTSKGISVTLTRSRDKVTTVAKMPSTKADDSRRLVLTAKILMVMYASISKDRTISMRWVIDLQRPWLKPSQRGSHYYTKHVCGDYRHSSSMAYDIAETAGLPLEAFGIIPEARGNLICRHPVTIARETGSDLHFEPFQAIHFDTKWFPTAIEIHGNIEKLLYTEKIASMEKLNDLGILTQERVEVTVLMASHGRLDRATVRLLHLLADAYPAMQMNALFDGDPYGVSMMANLWDGSSRFPLQSSRSLRRRVRWLGLRLSQMEEMIAEGENAQFLLPLGEGDWNQLSAMRRRGADWEIE
ncbi:hypothetical protein I350_05220 [Cryptococcus amylolentus CBS 6273]|uniref:Topoisomerase 6 subunit A/Spo11 TOPRIM domain-containing protein n=1 Tax=Cryptococcus amylolentus CBS 6273 TaxID=1296118 RepID=A0A1E3JUW9_9TREE|nr:hypothetical protein I350_05220 [Cryptococcus amylolentus CBS 6273]